jgi:hypothetical protein
MKYSHPRPVCSFHIFFNVTSYKGRFSKKKLLKVKCVFWKQSQMYIGLYVKYIGLYVKYIGLYVKYIGLYVKYPLFMSDFHDTRIFSKYFRNILKYQISWKSVECEPSCSVRTDGQADRTKLTAAFRNFEPASKGEGAESEQKHIFKHHVISDCRKYYY